MSAPAVRPRVVLAEPLTASAFTPFGRVISAGLGVGSAANQGTAVRFDRAARPASTRPSATPNLAVFRSTPCPLPFSVRLLERHPCSTQLFAPMKTAGYLVIVAPTGRDGAPELAGLSAFTCGAGQAIQYDVGVWHHPIVALDEPSELLMLAWEDGGPDDCVEHPLVEPWQVELGPACG